MADNLYLITKVWGRGTGRHRPEIVHGVFEGTLSNARKVVAALNAQAKNYIYGQRPIKRIILADPECKPKKTDPTDA